MIQNSNIQQAARELCDASDETLTLFGMALEFMRACSQVPDDMGMDDVSAKRFYDVLQTIEHGMIAYEQELRKVKFFQQIFGASFKMENVERLKPGSLRYHACGRDVQFGSPNGA